MRKRFLVFFIISLLLFMSGCAKKSTNNYNNSVSPQAPGYSEGSKPGDYPASDNDGKGGAETRETKIIKNYDMSLTVDDLKKLSKDLDLKAKELGGYIQNDQTNEYNVRAIIRIPSEKTDSFLEFVDKNYEVSNKSSKVDDITQAYIDNEARLKNLKAQEVQTLEILKKANTVDEILKVQNEIYRVRGEIEVLENTKKNWDRLIDYSTITITANRKILVEEKETKLIGLGEFFNAIGKGIANSAKDLVYGIERFFIFIFGNVIWIALLAAAGVIGYKIVVKYSQPNHNKKE